MLQEGNKMTKMQLFAKIVLIGLGFSFFCQTVRTVEVLVPVVFSGPHDQRLAMAIALVILSSVGLVISYLLLFRHNKWIDKIVPFSGESIDVVHPIWIVSGYRLVTFLFGAHLLCKNAAHLAHLLYLVFCIPALIRELIHYKDIYYAFFLSSAEWFQLAIGSAMLALGIYLILGAHHFMRWHLQRIPACTYAKGKN